MRLSANNIKTLAQFVKATGKKSVLQTKPFQFHGTNPSLSYEKSGKEFELPRFSSIEMQQARAMNKIAIKQIKTPVNRTYPKANSEDLKRLTSQTVEDTFSRVEWTNPKDGKIYNLLKQGETDDGKIVVRILDSDGAFIKEAQLVPKNIVILDEFQKNISFDLPHGEIVSIFAKRHNPFANYIKIQKDITNPESPADIKAIQDIIQNKGKVDYISFSYSINVSGVPQHKIKLPPQMQKLLQDQPKLENIPNTRILCAAGNAKQQENAKDMTNHLLISQRRIEGVGSLSKENAKISEFSCSRNSEITQHYEAGEFLPQVTQYGINITELPGTDFVSSSRAIQQIQKNPLYGKSVARVDKLLAKIQSRIQELQSETANLFRQKKPISEILKQKTEIDKQINANEQRKRKVFDYINQLVKVDGKYAITAEKIDGTSVATPTRTAKLALNEMMEGIL